MSRLRNAEKGNTKQMITDDRPDEMLIAKKFIELSGGANAVFVEAEAVITEFNNLWKTPLTHAPAILKAHLMVEHYLDKLLVFWNPRLGDLDDARLTFAQKAALVKGSDELIDQILPGIDRLNRIRNRVSHKLNYELSEEDIGIFLAIWPYKIWREAFPTKVKIQSNPEEIALHFAKFACLWMISIVTGGGTRYIRARELVCIEQAQGNNKFKS